MTPAQLALARVMAQGEDIVPIPGTKRVRYLKQNAAAEIRLSVEELRRIEAVASVGVAAGDRYPDMSTVHRGSPVNHTKTASRSTRLRLDDQIKTAVDRHSASPRLDSPEPGRPRGGSRAPLPIPTRAFGTVISPAESTS